MYSKCLVIITLFFTIASVELEILFRSVPKTSGDFAIAHRPKWVFS